MPSGMASSINADAVPMLSPCVTIDLPLAAHEVPDLREAVGWDRHDWAYPQVLGRVLFWAGARDDAGRLVAFAYVAGTGLPHGYLEDVLVHPDWQRRGVGVALVRALLREAELRNVGIVTVTFQPEHRAFYEACGFRWCNGGLWTAGP
jgi:GNAT superfamily N-acetyltransferase